MARKKAKRQVASRKRATRDFAWKLERVKEKSTAKVVTLWRRWGMSEYNFLRRYEGLPEIYGVSLPDVRVGEAVEVTAFFENGMLTARNISVLGKSKGNPENEVEITITNTVEAIENNVWTVANQAVAISEKTKIGEGVGLGDLVKIKASVGKNRSLKATQIELAEDPRAPVQLRIVGKLERKKGDVWTVAGWPVTVSPQTLLEGYPSASVIDEERSIAFLTYRLEGMPWDYKDPSRNLDLMADLLYGSPQRVIDVVFRPDVAEATEMNDYIEEAVAEAKEHGVYSEGMTRDLIAAKEYIARERIQTEKFAVYPPAFFLEEERRPQLDELTLGAREVRALTASLLHGPWNRSRWQKVEEEREKHASEGSWDKRLMNAISPLTLLREPWGVVTRGMGGEPWSHARGSKDQTFFHFLRTRGLGFRHLKPDNPESEKLLNMRSWLMSFLPLAIENPKEAIVLETSYYIPKVLDSYESEGRRFPIGSDLSEVEELETIQDLDNIRDKEEEEGKKILTEPQRRVVGAYDEAMNLIKDRPDTRVRVSYKIGVAASTRARANKLRDRVKRRLEDRNIDPIAVTTRAEQLEDIRSLCFPIIPEQDVLVNTTPLPLREVTIDTTPPEEFTIPEGILKAFVGRVLSEGKMGEVKFWPFNLSFMCLGGQRSGKSALGSLLIARFHHLLPWESVFWLYRLTNTRRPDGFQEFDIPALARMMNKGRLTNPEDGILYAQDYTSADAVYSQLMRLREQGARLLVFQASDSLEQEYELGLGFTKAYKDYMEDETPGVLGVDEVAVVAKFLKLLEEFGERIAPDSSKKNQLTMGFGHTSLGMNDHVRKMWMANVDRVLVGPTQLVPDVAKETQIWVEVFPEVARKVGDIVMDIKVRDIPGVFVETGAGGRIMEVFQSLVIYDEYKNFIERKAAKTKDKYGR